MIGRLMGFCAAILFTGLCVVGISALIASDFEEVGVKLQGFYVWVQDIGQETRPSLGKADALGNTSDITFFHKEPIAGTDLVVSTGIAFASLDDVIEGKTTTRWCYIQVKNGSHVTKRIDLGSQSGRGQPKFNDTKSLTEEQLRGIDIPPDELDQIARSHCLLQGFDPTVSRSRSIEPKRMPGLPNPNRLRHASLIEGY